MGFAYLLPILAAFAGQATAATAPSFRGLPEAAHCIAERNRHVAADLARATPASAEERRAWTALERSVRTCPGAGALLTHANRPLFAGALAQALYLRSITSWRSRPRADALPAAALAQVTAEQTADWPAEAAFAECLAALAPNQVDHLLRQPAGVDAENEAFAVLQPTFSLCLPDRAQLSLSRVRLRAELARAMFRMVSLVARPLLPGTR